MNTTDQIIRHAMPSDQPGTGDTSWFDRQNAFEREELTRLVAYKRDVLNITEDGRYSKRPTYTYPHILPDGHLSAVFYRPLAGEIISYLEQEGIQQHTELLNLKSSQATCLNLLFPLRKDLRLAAAVLCKPLKRLKAVTDIQFEFTGQDESRGDHGCTRWLGEPPGGKRGQNRTSIDAAIFWGDVDGRNHITLVEWKYTERSFGSCSAFDNAGKEEKTGCLTSTFKETCLLTAGGPRRSRHYWEHLSEAGIDLGKMECVAGCPFRGPFYQLMRQFLVAQYLRQGKPTPIVDVVTIHFGKNEALRAVPTELTPLCQKPDMDVLDAWNTALSGAPEVRAVKVEEIMDAYDSAPGVDSDWRKFIRLRYRI